jgi:hypothetical protein
MKIRLAAIIPIAVIALLTSCATMLGPRQVELPLWQLQDSLQRRLPFNNRYLELLDISVSNPRLALQPETNRLLTSMDAVIAPAFVQKSWRGSLTLSGTMRFDAGRNAIMMADPRVESFTADGLDPFHARLLGKIGSLLADHLLSNVPLYIFGPDELRYAGTRFIPTSINATQSGLVVTFEPVR